MDQQPIDLEFNPLPPAIATEVCPICSRRLPLSEFGLCRARRSGRNLYCKPCILKKVKQSRAALRDYLRARQRAASIAQVAVAAQSERPTPHRAAERCGHGFLTEAECSSPKHLATDRVVAAIHHGSRIVREILCECYSLSTNEIEDALATLILDTREVRTELRGDERFYFLIETAQSERAGASRPSQPANYRNGPGPVAAFSFASLGGIVAPKSNFTVVGPSVRAERAT